jgi:hypothetical protein
MTDERRGDGPGELPSGRARERGLERVQLGGERGEARRRGAAGGAGEDLRQIDDPQELLVDREDCAQTLHGGPLCSETAV